MKIKIKLHEGATMPETYGEWTDLAAAADYKIMSMDKCYISLGVSMELPKGYYAEVLPRSSTCRKYGIMMTNSMGIIENDYNGDDDVWCFPAISVNPMGSFVPKGARIAQFRLVKQSPAPEFEQVDHLGNDNRGGLGSTGD